MARGIAPVHHHANGTNGTLFYPGAAVEGTAWHKWHKWHKILIPRYRAIHASPQRDGS